MGQKEWLKKELQEETMGSMRAMFDTTLALLKARITWLEKNPASVPVPARALAGIIKEARDDMERWRDELELTEEDEV